MKCWEGRNFALTYIPRQSIENRLKKFASAKTSCAATTKKE